MPELLVTQGFLLRNIVISFVGITESTQNIMYFDIVNACSSRLVLESRNSFHVAQ